MSLTKAERAALASALHEINEADASSSKSALHEALSAAFLAGLRMGRAEGREQAAKACKDEQDSIQRSWERAGWNEGPAIGGHRCAEVIAALPEEPT